MCQHYIHRQCRTNPSTNTTACQWWVNRGIIRLEFFIVPNFSFHFLLIFNFSNRSNFDLSSWIWSFKYFIILYVCIPFSSEIETERSTSGQSIKFRQRIPWLWHYRRVLVGNKWNPASVHRQLNLLSLFGYFAVSSSAFIFRYLNIFIVLHVYDTRNGKGFLSISALVFVRPFVYRWVVGLEYISSFIFFAIVVLVVILFVCLNEKPLMSSWCVLSLFVSRTYRPFGHKTIKVSVALCPQQLESLFMKMEEKGLK